MNLTRPIEWEIRGVLLIRGKPCDSQLGHGFGRSEPEAIAHWKQKKLSGWAKDACAVYGIPAPIFRVNRFVAALTLLGSLALTSEPAWGVSEWNTLEIHTPTPRALVREGAISPTASEATPTPRFNCRSENRLGILRESEDLSEDGTHSSCNPALMGKLADGGQLSSPHTPH